MHPVLAEIIGWEFLLVLAVIALLFGGSRLPKLARSLGEASKEFRKGVEEGERDPDGGGSDRQES
jgi:sec-independent protein translocase protein TatA